MQKVEELKWGEQEEFWGSFCLSHWEEILEPWDKLKHSFASCKVFQDYEYEEVMRQACDEGEQEIESFEEIFENSEIQNLKELIKF